MTATTTTRQRVAFSGLAAALLLAAANFAWAQEAPAPTTQPGHPGARTRIERRPPPRPGTPATTQPGEMHIDSSKLPEVKEEELKAMEERLREARMREAHGHEAAAAKSETPSPTSATPGAAPTPAPTESPAAHPAAPGGSPTAPVVPPPTPNVPPAAPGAPAPHAPTPAPGASTPHAPTPAPGAPTPHAPTPAAPGSQPSGPSTPVVTGDHYAVVPNPAGSGPQFVRPKDWYKLLPEERKYFFVWKNTPINKTFEDLLEATGLSPIGQIEPAEASLPQNAITFESQQMQDFDEALTTYNELIVEKNFWVVRSQNYLVIRRLADWLNGRYIPATRMYNSLEAYRNAKLPAWDVASMTFV
ncbi:MAG: hypothetical protein FWC56_06045, partial [Phycisphaerae bacterium]|nr:hypothetical protein [Phycisphaerae bacterium]